jgi:ribose transport system permease protein
MVVVNVVLVTWLLPARGLDSAWVDVPILLAVGAGVGLLNGVLVALLRFQPIIATLCTFFVLGGLAEAISPNQAIAGPNWTTSLGEKLGFFPGALVLIAVPLVLWLLLGLTSFRRTLLAVGSSDTAAYSAGVNVTAVRLAAYCLGGVFAAVGGIALTALVESSQSDQATAFTVLALAAVALGGTPIGRGGRGGMVGSLFGALSIYLIQTLLGAAQVSSAYLQLVYGAMLLTGIVIGARMQLAGRAGVRAVRA